MAYGFAVLVLLLAADGAGVRAPARVEAAWGAAGEVQDVTPGVSSAVIFADDFETGDLSRWSVDAACSGYLSSEQEHSPVQVVGAWPLPHADTIVWSRPASWTWLGAFVGTVGQPAVHEGVDYVHDDAAVQDVPVAAAADGQVVYVRLGCPQSAELEPNTALRECGAGWGNHVVVLHGYGVFTRYAHLEPGTIVVRAGMRVLRGDHLGMMGNSGRSDVRHLHFELGTDATSFDPCAPAQSMDVVVDSENLPWTSRTLLPRPTAHGGAPSPAMP